jgi:hypothetical protein
VGQGPTQSCPQAHSTPSHLLPLQLSVQAVDLVLEVGPCCCPVHNGSNERGLGFQGRWRAKHVPGQVLGLGTAAAGKEQQMRQCLGT